MYFRDKEELFHYLLKRYQDGLLQRLERVLEERNHHVGDFRHIVEISDLFVIKELVKADCGITFLYRKAVEKELAEGSLCQVALTDFQISHEFTFLWRKNSAFEAELRETSRACGHCKKRSRKAAALLQSRHVACKNFGHVLSNRTGKFVKSFGNFDSFAGRNKNNYSSITI